ncbi:MAG: hypothetical protein V3T83_17275 [Acidobacteriota bacterium]
MPGRNRGQDALVGQQAQRHHAILVAQDLNLKSLARAILAQAFWDALAPPRRKNEDLRDDAVEWFSSSEQTPGSFHWICSILHIDYFRVVQLR